MFIWIFYYKNSKQFQQTIVVTISLPKTLKNVMIRWTRTLIEMSKYKILYICNISSECPRHLDTYFWNRFQVLWGKYYWLIDGFPNLHCQHIYYMFLEMSHIWLKIIFIHLFLVSAGLNSDNQDNIRPKSCRRILSLSNAQIFLFTKRSH